MARHGVFIAPFDELYDPRTLVDLAVRAEERGWDGIFLWDHVRYRAPVRRVADPWIVMAAIAQATSTIRLGPMITPPARRRAHKLARETVTLDHLSDGRLIFGAGLGSDSSKEFEDFEPGAADPKERARRYDEGLQQLAAYWDGGFEPRPVQQPRIPVWLAGRYPNRRPIERARDWDGFFPIDLPGPEALPGIKEQLRAGQDLVITDPPGADWQAWVDAGATWCLTGWDHQPRLDVVTAAIEDGPPRTRS
jgi:alkanesulfonate monooxygenase SsuD/methylene tetrahydromethanopterin reductase-like flavin-dependent oxidoreductase (luciferase family)